MNAVQKIGKITAFRELIEMLDISGSMVVADALHCTRKSAQAVVQAGADYLFCVKDITPNLKDDIALYVQIEPMEHVFKTEKNGGRIETRLLMSHGILSGSMTGSVGSTNPVLGLFIPNLRKIALNLARDFKAKSNLKFPISGILKRNLFDLLNLKAFLALFKLD